MKRTDKETVPPKPLRPPLRELREGQILPLPPSTPPSIATNAEVQKALEGLLHIAEMAMPDSYFQSDTRVKRAQRLLKKVSKV